MQAPSPTFVDGHSRRVIGTSAPLMGHFDMGSGSSSRLGRRTIASMLRRYFLSICPLYSCILLAQQPDVGSVRRGKTHVVSLPPPHGVDVNKGDEGRQLPLFDLSRWRVLQVRAFEDVRCTPQGHMRGWYSRSSTNKRINDRTFPLGNSVKTIAHYCTTNPSLGG